MTVVKINAITVPEGKGEALEERFRNRRGEVERMPGFLSFELLRPTNGETRYFVYTRWESEAAFQAWVQSDAFKRGHSGGQASSSKPVATGSHLLEFEIALSSDASHEEASKLSG
jgi:heme-degrading monooxygenase HmoA